MLNNDILILILSFLFGFTSKLADLLNEHGLKWFKYSDVILGFIWGGIGSLIIVLDQNIAIIYVATTLYWFLRIKLDYLDHALAGVMIIFTILWVSESHPINFNLYLIFFLWLAITGYLNTYLKTHYQNNHLLMSFLRLRLRYYIGPLALSVYVNDIIPCLSIVLGMLGTEILAVWFEKYKEIKKSNIGKKLGFKLVLTSRHSQKDKF